MLRCSKCKSTDVFLMIHETTGNKGMLSRPSGDVKAAIVLRKKTVDGKEKTVWAYPKEGDSDFGQEEFVLHRAVCKAVRVFEPARPKSGTESGLYE